MIGQPGTANYLIRPQKAVRSGGEPPALRGELPGLILTAAAFALATGIVFANLTRHGLWLDELYTFNAVRLPFADMLLERLRRGHPALYFIVLRTLLPQASGQPVELFLRLPSAGFWLLAQGSVAVLAFRMFPLRIACLTVTFASLNSLGIAHALNARMYSMVLFEGTWVSFSYLAILQGDRRVRWRIAFLLGTIAGFCTSPTFALLSGAFAFDSILRRKTIRNLVGLTFSSLGIGFVYLIPGIVLYLWTPSQIGPAEKQPLQILSHFVALFGGVLRGDKFHRCSDGLKAARVLGALLTVVVFSKAWTSRGRLRDTTLTCWRTVSFPVVLMLLFWAIGKAFDMPNVQFGSERYVVGLIPCGALFSATIIADHLAARRSHCLVAHAAVLIMLTLGTYGVVRQGTEPFRKHVQRLAAFYKPGDAVVVIPREIAPGFSAYAPGIKVNATLRVFEDNTQTIEATLKPLAKYPSVWIVWYRAHAPEVVKVAERLLGPYACSCGRPPDRHNDPTIDIICFGASRDAVTSATGKF